MFRHKYEHHLLCVRLRGAPGYHKDPIAGQRVANGLIEAPYLLSVSEFKGGRPELQRAGAVSMASEQSRCAQ